MRLFLSGLKHTLGVSYCMLACMHAERAKCYAGAVGKQIATREVQGSSQLAGFEVSLMVKELWDSERNGFCFCLLYIPGKYGD